MTPDDLHEEYQGSRHVWVILAAVVLILGVAVLYDDNKARLKLECEKSPFTYWTFGKSPSCEPIRPRERSISP